MPVEAKKTEQKIHRFRLKVGSHTQKGRMWTAGERGNNIVESADDLVARFGPDKFEKLPDGFVPPEVEEEEDLGATIADKPLERMNLAELKEFAEEKEIDLGPAVTKAEILGVIKESLMG